MLLPGIPALALSGYALWIAALWLVAAVLQRSPAWFSAFQLAVSVAVVFAENAAFPEWQWYDPYCLQAYGIGLALLGLVWIGAHMALFANPLVANSGMLRGRPWIA